ncbi:MAG: glycosyltransferase family 2 protein [Methanosarcina sp.]
MMSENLNNKNMKLSIAIPTYNGSLYIQETLDSIIPQLENINEEVEIVISDNASTDGTPKIIREYQNKYPFIKYFHNEENLGVDRNFDLAVRRSMGEYVWFLGDDDKMANGGIRKVLDVLKDNPKLAVIFMNCKMFNRNFDKCSEEKVLDIERDILFDKADSFFQKVGATAALVPSSIVRRDLWLSVEKRRYEGTGWLHLATLFHLLPGHPSYCISTPYSLFREGTPRWHKNGKFLKMIITLFDIIKPLPEYGYKEVTVKRILDPILKNMPLTIFGEKVNGLSVNFFLLKEMVTRFHSSPSFWSLSFPLLLLPGSVHRAFWKVCTTPSVKPVAERAYESVKKKLGA